MNRWGGDIWQTVDARQRAIVGAASFWTTGENVRAYGKRLEVGIKALLSDIERTLVTDDIEALMRQADASPTSLSYAAELRKRAGELRERATRRTPERIAEEQGFSKAYREFVRTWDQFQKDISEFRYFGMSPGEAWEATEAYDSQYQRYRDQYAQRFGQVPTSPSIVAPDKVQTEHATPSKPLFEIPHAVWWVAGALGVVVVGKVLASK